MMETLNSHPSNALQAKAFTSPASLSFPGGTGDLTPPFEQHGANGAQKNLQGPENTGSVNVVTPATPAATPGAGTGVSGIVPTLQ